MIPPLVRHIYDLHAIREYYDIREVSALAREIIKADAETYGHQFPAYEMIRSQRRCAPLRELPSLANLPVRTLGFSGTWCTEWHWISRVQPRH